MAGQPRTAYMLASDGGEILNVVGDRVRILADSESTGGGAAVFEDTTSPGMGPPLHRHQLDDEFFYVIEGTVKFAVDGREFVVNAGGFAFAPRGSVHAFRNVGLSPSRMLVTCTPAGLDRAFREADQLEREGRANPETLAAAFARIGVEFLGPPLAG